MQKYKLVFYVPLYAKEKVKNAVFESGAGKIDNYSHCAFEVEGVGQFRPLKGSNPHIGEIDRVRQVLEAKVEILCTEDNIDKAIANMKAAHPYEVVAYEVYLVVNK